VTSIINPNTGRTTAITPATRRVISAQAASTLTTMLTHVVDDPGAEGFAARIPGWTGEIAAKTGTAQEDVNGSLTGTDVSFAGFLPASNPRFTMMVLINEPQVPASQDYGSVLAGPVWHEMSVQMIDHWHLTP
jgi:cell division protein FtsI (penicillin-binding protein 3)